jgi:hypothetical protein
MTTTATLKRSLGSREDTPMMTPSTTTLSNAVNATAVSSFTNNTTSSVSASLQYYNNLIQHQLYNLRKNRHSHKRKSKHDASNTGNTGSSIWTVQMPTRILFSTMGIFLLLPVLLFVYKELHIQTIQPKDLRGIRQYKDRSNVYIAKGADQNQEYVTWMTDHLDGDEVEEGDGNAPNDFDVNAAVVNETSASDNVVVNDFDSTNNQTLSDLENDHKNQVEEDILRNSAHDDEAELINAVIVGGDKDQGLTR